MIEVQVSIIKNKIILGSTQNGIPGKDNLDLPLFFWLNSICSF